MIVRSSTITIARLLEDMQAKRIRVNRDYQRSSVWSTAARSYLIETILLGYPIPKIYLWEKTDLSSRRTHSEIVDGQQRCSAILSFSNDEFAITARGDFTRQKYSDLDEDAKVAFIEYGVGIDVLTGATPQQVREVYRRINSYTTPLTPQEKRFAAALGGEGSIKYLILNLATQHSDVFIRAGTVTERDVARMRDQEWIAKFIDLVLHGVRTASPKHLDQLYRNYDEQFPRAEEMDRRLNELAAWVARHDDLHRSKVFGAEQLLTLGLALSHSTEPIHALGDHGVVPAQRRPEREAHDRLLELDAALDNDGLADQHPLKAFVEASSAGTNTISNRLTRFKYYLAALCVVDGPT